MLTQIRQRIDNATQANKITTTNQQTPASLYITVIVLILSSVIPLVAAYNTPIFLNDDSYITLTYAKNLALGNGFVFNHPPAVLGTTTPLFTLLLAALAVIFPFISLPTIAIYLTAYCWIGIIWTVFFFRRAWSLENWQVGILALVLVGSGWIGFLGMEAYLFAFLLMLSLSLFLIKHFWFAGIATGLLFLTRGEGVLIVGVLLGTLGVQYWFSPVPNHAEMLRKAFKLIAGFTIAAILWAMYALATFGSILPNTLAAKQAQGKNGLGLPFLQQLVNEWSPLWGTSFRIEGLPFINFWWLIVLVGLVATVREKHTWLMLVGWITLYTTGYIVLNVSAYWWYQLPIVFVLNILFGLGVIKIVELLRGYITNKHVSLGASIVVTLVLIFLLAKPTGRAMFSYKGDQRGKSYVELSRWFREHTNATASIGFIEIGYLSYYTENRIVDLAGLVLTDVSPHIAQGDFTWGFWNYKPDYYIHLPEFDWALRTIRADPRFDQQYQAVATLPGPRETDFVIYKRTVE